MANIILKDAQIVSISDARQLVIRDFQRMKYPMECVNDNVFTYYVTINTWLLQWRDASPTYWDVIALMIENDGLIATIERCSSFSQNWIQSAFEVMPDDAALSMIITSCIGDNITLDLVHVMQLLRYPKRLTLVGIHEVDDMALQDFISWENRTKLFCRRNDNRWLLPAVREEVRHITRFWKKALSSYEEKSYLSSGVAHDSNKNIVCKVITMNDADDNFIYHPTPMRKLGTKCHHERPNQSLRMKIREGLNEGQDNTVTITAVPKSMGKSRIIAPDSVYRQYHMNGIMRSLIPLVEAEGCPITDQKVQQRKAKQGSIDGSFSTIDMSHASDSVSKALVRSIFPNDIANMLLVWAPTNYFVSGQRVCKGPRVMHQYATSGSSLTFIVESVVFLAIARAAVRYYFTLTGHTNASITRKVASVSVYGDDTIVPNEAAELCIEFLQALGFTVNTEKSFWQVGKHMFRESCGVECVDGFDISSQYLPRTQLLVRLKDGKFFLYDNREIKDNNSDMNNTIASLISLQHRVPSTQCRRFLAEVIKGIVPQMTTHTSLTGNDLFGHVSTRPHAYAPHKRGSDISNLPEDVISRERVCAPKIKRVPLMCKKRCCIGPRKWDTHEREYIYELWRYEQFLQYGPYYEDSLLELLNVSVQRYQPYLLANKQEVTTWTLQVK